MIVYRERQSFRIDSSDASNDAAGKRFAEARPGSRVVDDVARELERITLEYRRWWAEGQPEVRWAAMHATGAYVVDVSHIYWCDKTFLLTFEASSDASRFALLFLGLDQVACESVVAADMSG